MIEWLFYIFVLPWLVVGGIFPAYPTIQRLKHEDKLKELGKVALIPMGIVFFIGALADVLFNLIWGSIIFREIPHEFLFTTRLKKHWRGDNEKMKERAAPWVHRINLVDPGHI